jgi:lipopolysaccharide transport system ATP-binding protein
MSQPIITVDRLSKAYRLGLKEESADTLAESIAAVFTAPVRNWRRLRSLYTSRETSPGDDILWALDGVSFHVARGEVVGIIGRNGAGKSTLLKILSRITEPTSGRVVLKGRVSSLLEVGTGFHPELTGRDNIYMNGTILGMRKHEIDRKFDEIVEFSGVSQFLDTPVKRYSSGMTVRLAFAVAAHLEPEILVIDEVLAVGDAEFQKKCIGKMRDVAHGGRTVLFVSHNMAAVESLCSRGIELRKGRVLEIGPARDVVAHYRRHAFARVNESAPEAFAKARYFRAAELLDEGGNVTSYLPVGTAFCLRILLDPPQRVLHPHINVLIETTAGERMLTLQTPASRRDVGEIAGPTEVRCCVRQFPAAPGEYVVRLQLLDGRQGLEHVGDAALFSVVDGDLFGEGRGFNRGYCVAPGEWSQSQMTTDLKADADA